MNELAKNKLIVEQKCEDNFAYTLDEALLFSNTDYKVLQSSDKGAFVKCMKLFFNGKIQMLYMTSGLKPFSAIVSQLDPDRFIVIVEDIFRNIFYTKSNGFLKVRNIDVSMEHLYVDLMTNDVYLIYLPTKTGFYSDDFILENELRDSLAQAILVNGNLASPKTMKLYMNLRDSSIQFQEVMDNIQSVIPKKKTKSSSTEKVKDRIGKMRMISLNSPEAIIFTVDIDEYVIGRSMKYANGVIRENKMVGREHCCVTRTESGYFLKDLDSANGTSINSVRLEPQVKQQIKNGDIIRIANYDFKVQII